MSAPDLHHMGVAELAQAIADKKTSSAEATQHLLARAKQHQALGAYLSFNEEASLAQARVADERLGAFLWNPLVRQVVAVRREEKAAIEERDDALILG